MNVPELAPLQQARSVVERVYASTAMAVTTMVLANTVDRSALVVHANDPLSKQAQLALPSALPAPSLRDYGRTVNVGTQIATTVVSFEAARSTSSAGELVGTAVAAQVASCGTDAAVERTGWLTQAERSQEDVGFSAIGTAWFTKFLLDRAQMSKDKGQRWLAATAAFAGTVAVGLPLYEGSQGGKLDAISHTAGLAVGFIAHKLGRPKAEKLKSKGVFDSFDRASLHERGYSTDYFIGDGLVVRVGRAGGMPEDDPDLTVELRDEKLKRGVSLVVGQDKSHYQRQNHPYTTEEWLRWSKEQRRESRKLLQREDFSISTAVLEPVAQAVSHTEPGGPPGTILWNTATDVEPLPDTDIDYVRQLIEEFSKPLD